MCKAHLLKMGKKHPRKELKIHFLNTARFASMPTMQKQLDNTINLNGGMRTVEELSNKLPIASSC